MRAGIMRATAAALVLALVSFGAGAAEITFICSNALKSVMEELAPQFEKASGHRLRVTYGTTGPLQARSSTSPSWGRPQSTS
jgi:molybdate transport system substrate-binding protein